jgi:tRNA pseudouridine38-40 synthase
VQIYGAGRTDAGVHALGQVVSCPSAPAEIDFDRTIRALNAKCGPSIVVSSCRPAAEDWHARFSARSRAYVYAIFQAPIPNPFLAGTALHEPRPLDIDAMNEAAGHLVGARDFSSFGRVPEDGSPIRTLYELRVSTRGPIVRVYARANSFIQQMVRSLVGTLLEVGRGKMTAESVVAILRARDRAAAGPVAPPHGLCLVAVEYDEGWSRPVDLTEPRG